MPTSPILEKPAAPASATGSTWRIISFVFFTFTTYISIGLPMAVLPAYVHLSMGMSVALAGLVISVQSVATLISRPLTGRICDRLGAKLTVLSGMGFNAAAGIILIAATLLHHIPWLCLFVLVLSRLALGFGESLCSTGATLWGILSIGPSSTAKVITYNGIATYGALAAGAPIGVLLYQRWGLASIGLLTFLLCIACLGLGLRKAAVKALPGEHMPFMAVLGRITPHGLSLAMGGIGYGVLATFITLFFASRHWNGAALSLTIFGATFVLARLLFLHTIERRGGFIVAIGCLSVEALAMLLLWQSSTPWMAFLGAALTGFGFSMVFPALGVEAVRCVSPQNRGSALGIFNAFSDVTFFLNGPVAGAIIGAYGYPSVFLYALISVLVALGIAISLYRKQFRQAAEA
jgi:MFS family permease